MASFDFTWSATYTTPNGGLTWDLQGAVPGGGTIADLDGAGTGDFTAADTVMTDTTRSLSSFSYYGFSDLGLTGQEFVALQLSASEIIFYGNPPDPNNVGEPASIADTAIPATAFTTCFAAGTLIATPSGETAVEALNIGDLICTADGRQVAVKWVGFQTLHKLFTPAVQFCPVRISAGAMGPDLPHSDLTLTADHALLIDGLAINAAVLVNGRSITTVPAASLPDRATYYHIETENHEPILANGVPAESYVDYIARRAFDNYADYVALYGDDRLIAEMPVPRISALRLLPDQLKERFGLPSAESPLQRSA